jgi:hypothetical protein
MAILRWSLAEGAPSAAPGRVPRTLFCVLCVRALAPPANNPSRCSSRLPLTRLRPRPSPLSAAVRAFLPPGRAAAGGGQGAARGVLRRPRGCHGRRGGGGGARGGGCSAGGGVGPAAAAAGRGLQPQPVPAPRALPGAGGGRVAACARMQYSIQRWKSFANRMIRVWHWGDRNRPLNDGQQRPNSRGVRAALGTGYSRGEGNRRASRERSPLQSDSQLVRRCRPSLPSPLHPLLSFCPSPLHQNARLVTNRPGRGVRR